MADFVFNTGLGRVAEYAARVNANDPAASALILVVINAGAATDATLRDYATLAAIEADANAAEVTNVGYTRKTLTDTGLITVTITNASDKVEVDFPDPVWTAVATAGGAWTDLLVCYDADTAAGTDANIIPLVCLDFAVTPNGGDITYQVNASGIYRAT